MWGEKKLLHSDEERGERQFLIELKNVGSERKTRKVPRERKREKRFVTNVRSFHFLGINAIPEIEVASTPAGIAFSGGSTAVDRGIGIRRTWGQSQNLGSGRDFRGKTRKNTIFFFIISKVWKGGKVMSRSIFPGQILH